MACSKRINCSSSCPIRDLPPNFNCYNGHEIDVRRRRGLGRLGKRLKNKVRKYVFNKLNNPAHGPEGFKGPLEVPCTQCHAQAHQWYLGEVQQHAEAYHYASLNELKMIEADLEKEINELFEINTNFNSGHEAFGRKLEALSESMVKNREKTEATLQGVFQGLNSIWLKYKKTKTKNRRNKLRKNSSNIKETTSTQTVNTSTFNRSENSYGREKNEPRYEGNNQPDLVSPAGGEAHLNARARTIFTMRGTNDNNGNRGNPIWNQLSKSDKAALCLKNGHSAGRSTTSAVISTNHDTDSFQDLYRLKKGKPKTKSRAEVGQKEPEINPMENRSPAGEQERGLLSLIKDRLQEAVGIVDEMNGFLGIINADSAQRERVDGEITQNKSNGRAKSEEVDKAGSAAVLKNTGEISVKKKKHRDTLHGTRGKSQTQLKGVDDKPLKRGDSSEYTSDKSDEVRRSRIPAERTLRNIKKNKEKLSDESDKSSSGLVHKTRRCPPKDTIYQCDNVNNKSPKKKPSTEYLSRFDIEVKSGKETTEWKINAGEEQVVLHLKKDKNNRKLDQIQYENNVERKVLVEESSDEDSDLSSFYSHVLRGQRTPIRKGRPISTNYILNFLHEEDPLKKHDTNIRRNDPKLSRREREPKEKSTARRAYFNQSSEHKSTSETGRTLPSSDLKPKDAFASSSRGQTFVIEETLNDSSKTNTSDQSYVDRGKRRQFEIPSSAYDSINDSEMDSKNAFVKSFSN